MTALPDILDVVVLLSIRTQTQVNSKQVKCQKGFYLSAVYEEEDKLLVKNHYISDVNRLELNDMQIA